MPFTPDEWQTIRDAVDSLKYDVDDDPQEFLTGASDHLAALLKKLPTTLHESKVYLPEEGHGTL